MTDFTSDTTSLNQSWVERDLAHVWHPCTQMKDHESLPLIPIKRGDGVWLEDFEGKRYLDAVSSWWVNLFGHANPKISAAIQEQAATLEQVILGGFTHEPVIRLSEQLAKITPGNLNRCFYADNGSSAVEIALKMSFHYWLNQRGDQKKQRFIALGNGYHGETLAALAVGDVALYKETYQPLLLESIIVPSPDCYLREEGESWQSHSLKAADQLEESLQQNHESVCAIILEPLVQCAGNMRMYHPVYLKRVRELCDQYEVHLIADEIAVGFGRTGTLFACEQADVAPDLLCLSKGLTGGFLPLSTVVTTDEIYNAFYDDYETLRAFLHSHSFTGNPLGCAAALATLNLFDSQPVLEKNRQSATLMREAISELEDHPNISEIRQHGMILAMEMTPDGSRQTSYDWKERRGMRVYRHALEQGVLLRPLGNVVYFMPPYVITPDDIQLMAETAISGIQLATQD